MVSMNLSDLPEPLLRAALPESMRDLLEYIPLGAVLKIVEAYGGTCLYVPAFPVPDNGIGKLIGLEAAQSLASYAGSSRIAIPTLDKVRVVVRRVAVLDSLAGGASLKETARAFGITTRSVSYIRAKHEK